jgi:hypothetical protein
MKVTTIALVVVASAATFALGACSDDGAPAAGTGPSEASSANAAPTTSSPCGAGSDVGGDVDGDGAQDRVSLAGKASGDSCRYVLTARTASGAHSLVLPGEPSFAAPPNLSLAAIDRDRALEIVADTWHGASTAFAGVFTIRSGELIEMRGAPPAGSGGSGFPYAGGSTHQNGVDCSNGPGSGLVVATGAAPTPRDRWKVTRRFYRVQGAAFVSVDAMTAHLTVPAAEGSTEADLSPRFLEFADRPFASCTQATPQSG